MFESKGNLFEYMNTVDAICVTTNGVIKQNGDLVMGAGLALEFKKRWPNLPAELGKWVKVMGNIPAAIAKPINVSSVGVFTPGVSKTLILISFPTKHHFKDNSCLQLIQTSAHHLINWADKLKLSHVALTRPGCGLGRLNWDYEVRPILSNILDDRFTVVS